MPYGHHGLALVGGVRAALCVRRGDVAGAEQALARAYPAAVECGDMQILALVAVIAAGLAELHGRPRDVAVILGAASRLRGAHDRTDPQVRDMAGKSRAALGDEQFAAAYEMGWELDGQTAVAQVDPARLRRAALPAPDRTGTQARRA
jgi:hypothetical protein